MDEIDTLSVQETLNPYFEDQFGDESNFQLPSNETLNNIFTTDSVWFSKLYFFHYEESESSNFDLKY